MESIAVTKETMGVLSREKLAQAAYGVLCQAFAARILARTGYRKGLYQQVALDFLQEKPEESAPPVQNIFNIDLHLVLKTLRTQATQRQTTKATEKLLEQVIRVQEKQHAQPEPGGTRAGFTEAPALTMSRQNVFLQALLQVGYRASRTDAAGQTGRLAAAVLQNALAGRNDGPGASAVSKPAAVTPGPWGEKARNAGIGYPVRSLSGGAGGRFLPPALLQQVLRKGERGAGVSPVPTEGRPPQTEYGAFPDFGQMSVPQPPDEMLTLREAENPAVSASSETALLQTVTNAVTGELERRLDRLESGRTGRKAEAVRRPGPHTSVAEEKSGAQWKTESAGREKKRAKSRTEQARYGTSEVPPQARGPIGPTAEKDGRGAGSAVSTGSRMERVPAEPEKQASLRETEFRASGRPRQGKSPFAAPGAGDPAGGSLFTGSPAGILAESGRCKAGPLFFQAPRRAEEENRLIAERVDEEQYVDSAEAAHGEAEKAEGETALERGGRTARPARSGVARDIRGLPELRTDGTPEKGEAESLQSMARWGGLLPWEKLELAYQDALIPEKNAAPGMAVRGHSRLAGKNEATMGRSTSASEKIQAGAPRSVTTTQVEPGTGATLLAAPGAPRWEAAPGLKREGMYPERNLLEGVRDIRTAPPRLHGKTAQSGRKKDLPADKTGAAVQDRSPLAGKNEAAMGRSALALEKIQAGAPRSMPTTQVEPGTRAADLAPGAATELDLLREAPLSGEPIFYRPGVSQSVPTAQVEPGTGATLLAADGAPRWEAASGLKREGMYPERNLFKGARDIHTAPPRLHGGKAVSPGAVDLTPGAAAEPDLLREAPLSEAPIFYRTDAVGPLLSPDLPGTSRPAREAGTQKEKSQKPNAGKRPAGNGSAFSPMDGNELRTDPSGWTASRRKTDMARPIQQAEKSDGSGQPAGRGGTAAELPLSRQDMVADGKPVLPVSRDIRTAHEHPAPAGTVFPPEEQTGPAEKAPGWEYSRYSEELTYREADQDGEKMPAPPDVSSSRSTRTVGAAPEKETPPRGTFAAKGAIPRGITTKTAVQSQAGAEKNVGLTAAAGSASAQGFLLPPSLEQGGAPQIEASRTPAAGQKFRAVAPFFQRAKRKHFSEGNIWTERHPEQAGALPAYPPGSAYAACPIPGERPGRSLRPSVFRSEALFYQASAAAAGVYRSAAVPFSFSGAHTPSQGVFRWEDRPAAFDEKSVPVSQGVPAAPPWHRHSAVPGLWSGLLRAAQGGASSVGGIQVRRSGSEEENRPAFPSLDLTYGQTPPNRPPQVPQPVPPEHGPMDSDYVKSLPDWVQNFLRGSGEEAAGAGSGSHTAKRPAPPPDTARDITVLPRPAVGGGQIDWSAPTPAGRPAELAYRLKEEPGPQPARPAAISDTEIRRTADRVYQIIEDRLRRERRRLGL